MFMQPMIHLIGIAKTSRISNDFNKEFVGLQNILTFLDLLKWDASINQFIL